MKSFSRLLLPAVLLFLSSCAWTFQPQKSNLQVAASAAKVAGDEEEASRHTPMILVPKHMQTADAAASGMPKVIVSSSASAAEAATDTAVPAPVVPNVPASTVAEASQPLAAGPVASAAPIVAAVPVQTIAPETAIADASSVESALSDDIATKVPVNGTAIHLASYREIGSAKRGWQILSRSYKELVPLKPLYVSVDIPGKGHMLRLYGTGSDTPGLKNICNEMKADGAYCAANIAF